MEHFPVTNSHLSARHLNSFLQDKYNFPAITSCKLLRTGINDTYLVDTGTYKYVFRVYSYNWRTHSEITEELRLIDLLKDHGLPVSFSLADIHKNVIQELNAPEGLRYGVLFSFAKGQKMQDYPNEVHFKIGKIMADMHRITQNIELQRISYTPETLLIRPFIELKKFISSDSDEMQFMAGAQTYLLNELNKVNITAIRKGAVHLDIWSDNLNITEAQEVTIFDFDFCGNGWLCLDIAFYILQIYGMNKNTESCKLKVESFLNGYESVLKITAEEKKMIPVLGICLYFFYLGIQCQRYDNWSNTFLNENYLKRYINMLVKRYYELHHLGE